MRSLSTTWGRIGKSIPGVSQWSRRVTYDGVLNDINGFHVKDEHVFNALRSAKSGPVEEGCVGGGTGSSNFAGRKDNKGSPASLPFASIEKFPDLGMICHDFKGGIGTSSRVVSVSDGGYTVGVLVQANYGQRALLRIDGVPVGRRRRIDPVGKS